MDGIILLFSFKSLQLNVEMSAVLHVTIIDCCSKPHLLRELVLFALVKRGGMCPLCPALDPPLRIHLKLQQLGERCDSRSPNAC